MDRIQRWLELLHDQKISNDFDRLVVVLGEEGMGKSTFILGAMEMWYRVLGRCGKTERPDPERIVGHITFDSRTEFKQQLLNSGKKDPIALMDAAHILHKKDAMVGDQKDIEKTLLDIRIENFLIFLGYQDWDDVPKQLQQRRAKNVLHIPKRGVVHGYSRQSMDDRLKDGEWPEPDLKDTFPALEGRELWEKFNEIDHERKRSRLDTEDEQDPEDVEWQAKAEMAVFLNKPWNDSGGVSQKEAGDIVGYSSAWVSERVQEWKKGNLEVDLLPGIPEPQHGGVIAP